MRDKRTPKDVCGEATNGVAQVKVQIQVSLCLAYDKIFENEFLRLNFLQLF